MTVRRKHARAQHARSPGPYPRGAKISSKPANVFGRMLASGTETASIAMGPVARPSRELLGRQMPLADRAQSLERVASDAERR